MKLHRRTVLRLAAGAAALAVSRVAHAQQAYPARPVRLVVGFPAGGSHDIAARLIGEWLTKRLGRQFVIDNRPGAAGNVAADAVAKSPPDGYTIFVAGANNAINATLYEDLTFNFVRDFAPVSGIMRVPNVIVVTPSFPPKTVPELIAYAKANPGKINMASGGNGSATHVSGELFKMMTGIDMVHVPYRGIAPALVDLIAGHVEVMFDNLNSSIEHIRAGRLRALGVTSAMPSDALLGIPTVASFVPGYEASAFFGIVAPKATPPEIVNRLNKEINAGLRDPDIKTQIKESGGKRLTGSPADFGKLLAKETKKWRKVVRVANIKAD